MLRSLEIQLAGSCSNPEVGVELRRMTKIAALIARASTPPRAADPPTPLHARPGWVRELVVAVLASADEPLSPQQVIARAERVSGRRLAPSSIRNALRGRITTPRPCHRARRLRPLPTRRRQRPLRNQPAQKQTRRRPRRGGPPAPVRGVTNVRKQIQQRVPRCARRSALRRVPQPRGRRT